MAQFFTFDGPYDPVPDTPRSYDSYGYDPLFDTPMTPPPAVEPVPPLDLGRYGVESYDDGALLERHLGRFGADAQHYEENRVWDDLRAKEGCMAIQGNDLLRDTCLKGLR